MRRRCCVALTTREEGKEKRRGGVRKIGKKRKEGRKEGKKEGRKEGREEGMNVKLEDKKGHSCLVELLGLNTSLGIQATQ